MSRQILHAAAALVLMLGAAGPALAQEPEVPVERQLKRLPRQHLAGPRFGFTTFTGDVAELRQRAGLQPIMTQFGWQFETQIVSLESANQALLEFVVLMGGFEQSEFNLTGAWLAGYRTETGLEFGVGPSVSYNADAEDYTTSMIIAGGATLPFGDLYVPVNLAIAIAEGGPRITTLLGWVVG
jgi:hypothetical protein